MCTEILTADKQMWRRKMKTPTQFQTKNKFLCHSWPPPFLLPQKAPCKWNKQDREKLSPLIITTALHTAHSTSTVHCTDQTSSCRFCWEIVVKHAFKMKNDHILSYEYHTFLLLCVDEFSLISVKTCAYFFSKQTLILMRVEQ